MVAASMQPAVPSLSFEERGVRFTVGPAFYRGESAAARDLAVLAATLYKRHTGQLRVLEAMSGSGARGARYLHQADADLVWCNDIDWGNRAAMLQNITGGVTAAATGAGMAPANGGPACTLLPLNGLGEVTECKAADGRVCRVSQIDAKRLLLSRYLKEDLYDLVDVDSFGSNGAILGPALDAVTHGGLLYVTCTDGLAAAGRHPETAVSAYGAYVHPLPFANEVGLRMLIGATVREGLLRNITVEPQFSLYAPHGPVYRCMLRIQHRKAPSGKNCGFLRYSAVTGETNAVNWVNIGQSARSVIERLRLHRDDSTTLTGPVWIGPLHDSACISGMVAEAEARGWSGLGLDVSHLPHSKSRKCGPKPLEQLLQLLLEESDARLHPWHINVNDVSKFGHLGCPPGRDALIMALSARGLAASRCHLDNQCFRTNASMAALIEVAMQDLGIQQIGAEMEGKRRQRKRNAFAK